MGAGINLIFEKLYRVHLFFSASLIFEIGFKCCILTPYFSSKTVKMTKYTGGSTMTNFENKCTIFASNLSAAP